MEPSAASRSAEERIAALASADAAVQRALELASQTMAALSTSDTAGAASASQEFISVVESIHKIVADAIVSQARPPESS